MQREVAATHHYAKVKSFNNLLGTQGGLSMTASNLEGTDVDVKMSTMGKQLDEKALKLKMLRDELEIMASDTLS